MRRSFYALSALCVAGIYISIELIRYHISVHYAGGADTGICSPSSGFSCEFAAQSQYAELFGFPIAGLGLAFYATLLIALVALRFGKKDQRGWQDVVLGGSLGAVGYSIFLAAISFTVLEKPCPLCMWLYGVNLGLLVFALGGHEASAGEALKGLPRLVTRPALWITVGIMAASVVGSQALYARGAEAARAAGALTLEKLTPKAPAKPLDITGVPTKGPENAKVTLVEFSDFQCPYCSRFSQSLNVALARVSGVKISFRNFPLDSSCHQGAPMLHPDACRAAAAGVCADRVGRFWQMHDLMFANQSKLSLKDLQGYAREAGVEVEAFTACLEDPATMARIQDDIAEGNRLGVQSTPTFFVNDKPVAGAKGVDEIVDLLREAGAK